MPQKKMKDIEHGKVALNVKVINIDAQLLMCWPGRSDSCQKPREWAVFHSNEEAQQPFNPFLSVYIGTCSQHLVLALTELLESIEGEKV